MTQRFFPASINPSAGRGQKLTFSPTATYSAKLDLLQTNKIPAALSSPSLCRVLPHLGWPCPPQELTLLQKMAPLTCSSTSCLMALALTPSFDGSSPRFYKLDPWVSAQSPSHCCLPCPAYLRPQLHPPELPRTPPTRTIPTWFSQHLHTCHDTSITCSLLSLTGISFFISLD